jgi:hypothetical protein
MNLIRPDNILTYTQHIEESTQQDIRNSETYIKGMKSMEKSINSRIFVFGKRTQNQFSNITLCRFQSTA